MRLSWDWAGIELRHLRYVICTLALELHNAQPWVQWHCECVCIFCRHICGLWHVMDQFLPSAQAKPTLPCLPYYAYAVAMLFWPTSTYFWIFSLKFSSQTALLYNFHAIPLNIEKVTFLARSKQGLSKVSVRSKQFLRKITEVCKSNYSASNQSQFSLSSVSVSSQSHLSLSSVSCFFSRICSP